GSASAMASGSAGGFSAQRMRAACDSASPAAAISATGGPASSSNRRSTRSRREAAAGVEAPISPPRQPQADLAPPQEPRSITPLPGPRIPSSPPLPVYGRQSLGVNSPS